MKIPDKVKVGAHVYDIVRSSDEGDYDARFGHCFPRKLKIYIDPNVAQSQAEETFFHEVLHAVCDQLHLFPKTSDGQREEEEKVQPLGHAIYQLLKDNDLLKNNE